MSKTVKLKKLIINDFRSKTMEIEFENQTVISGRNRCGKSTVKNAFLWLLTGYDDKDRANFNLFDTTREYMHDDNPPATVVGVFDIDGTEVELKRAAKMGWTRKRGNENYERKTSDDYSFAIDGIDRTAGEYKAWVENNLAPVEVLKCMLNTKHFLYNIDDWKKQRQMLSTIAGEISQADFKGDYTELFAEFAKYTPEQLADRVKTLLSPLKKALGSENIKGEKVIELEVLQNNLVDIKAIEDAEEKVKELQQRKADVEAVIRGLNAPFVKIQQARAALYAKIDEIQREREADRRAYASEQIANRSALETKIRTADETNANIQRENISRQKEYEAKKQRFTELAKELDARKKRLEELRQINIDIKNREFNGFNCAYCGAPLSQEEVERLQAQFEEQKETDRESNKLEGLNTKRNIEIIESNLSKLQAEIDEGVEPQKFVNIDEEKEELQKMIVAEIPYSDTDRCKAFDARVKEVNDSMPEFPQIDTKTQNEEIEALDREINEMLAITGQRRTYERQTAQIAEVQDAMKSMGQERARLEKIESQLSAYEQEKADIVSSRVNKYFDCCHVEMFAEKKDGTLAPNCVVYMDGRKSTTLNKEGTITAGIDVTSAFCLHYDVNLPLFVDDYESVSDDNSITTTRQVIFLKVSNSNLEIQTK